MAASTAASGASATSTATSTVPSIRLATIEDASAIRAIYAPYVETSITFEETVPSEEDFRQRVAGILATYPYLVVERGGVIVGYAYAHAFAERAAYRWNAELSIYLKANEGRHGVGTTLYKTLIDLLKLAGYRRVFGRVTMPNAASKRLHNKLGFTLEWTMKRAGWKAGRWRDVCWFSKQLAPQPEKAPDEPTGPTKFSEVDPGRVADIIAEANGILARNAEKPLVSATTRKCMQGNKGADTKPEQVVRQMLREMGYPGYRLQWKKCPGRPDIVYPGRKLAIFVHGCFWHRCPVCDLPEPKSNVDYWEKKFTRNVERDRENREALEADGWTVVTVWEHDLKPERREETSRMLYEVVKLDE